MKNVESQNVECVIEEYLQQHAGPNWASDIADALDLDYETTFKVIKKLLEEGRIEKAKKPP